MYPKIGGKGGLKMFININTKNTFGAFSWNFMSVDGFLIIRGMILEPSSGCNGNKLNIPNIILT